MYALTGARHSYQWGDVDALPTLLGQPSDGSPFAELWYGTHPLGPNSTQEIHQDGGGDSPSYCATTERSGLTLAERVACDPITHLGKDVAEQFSNQLPYLVKFIAPAQPLSLQVHPSIERAEMCFSEAEEAGHKLDDPTRSYKDPYHKPEMVYALTRFEALAGFLPPRRAIATLNGLGVPLAQRMRRTLRSLPNRMGMKRVVAMVLKEKSRPTADEVGQLVQACQQRLESGTSPFPETDQVVVRLADNYPTDPGVAIALLLNYISLMPGETLFTPAGTLHAYLSGLGLEVMANSDNVLRAGLTKKYVDVPELLACIDTSATPPVRIAPEHVGPAMLQFSPPVDEFVVTVCDSYSTPLAHHTAGPRIVLSVEGDVEVAASGSRFLLSPGRAVFLSASAEHMTFRGRGRIVIVTVP